MAAGKDALRELRAKGTDASFRRERIGVAAERAVAAALQAAWAHGVSTRAVDGLVPAPRRSADRRPLRAWIDALDGGVRRRQDRVSRPCAALAERAGALPSRPIPTPAGRPAGMGIEGEWPCLGREATCVRVRRAGRVVPAAATVAVAVNADGRRARLGLRLRRHPALGIGPEARWSAGAREAEALRTDVRRGPARRGRRGVKLVVADAREGPKAAVRRVAPAPSRRCRALS